MPRNAVKILSRGGNAVNAVTEFAEMQLKPAIPVFHSRSIEKTLKMQNAVKLYKQLYGNTRRYKEICAEIA